MGNRNTECLWEMVEDERWTLYGTFMRRSMRFVSLIRTGARVNPLSPVESERVESRGQAFRAFRYLLVSLWANNTFWNKLAVTSIGGARNRRFLVLSSFVNLTHFLKTMSQFQDIVQRVNLIVYKIFHHFG